MRFIRKTDHCKDKFLIPSLLPHYRPPKTAKTCWQNHKEHRYVNWFNKARNSNSETSLTQRIINQQWVFLRRNNPPVSCCTIQIVTDKSKLLLLFLNVVLHPLIIKCPYMTVRLQKYHVTLILYMTEFEMFEIVRLLCLLRTWNM